MSTHWSTSIQHAQFYRILDRWIFTKRALCYLLVVVLPSQAFVSCAGGSFLGIGRGNKYVYAYSMSAPIENPLMVFQDDSLKIQFKIDASAIRFQLQNLSRSVISVQWDNVSVGIDNAYSLVRHSLNMYADTVQGRGSVRIPPLGYIQDLMVPVENVFFDGSAWVQSDLFQTIDGGREEMAQAIQKNVGKSIVVIFPIQFGTTSKEYRFEFRIVSVKQILWRDFRPAKPIPPPPTKKTRIELADEITTAFIIVGLLGFAAFMISLKKTPVVE